MGLHSGLLTAGGTRKSDRGVEWPEIGVRALLALEWRTRQQERALNLTNAMSPWRAATRDEQGQRNQQAWRCRCQCARLLRQAKATLSHPMTVAKRGGRR